MGLTEPEQQLLDVAIAARASRRPQDADLRTVADWRDALLTAASNLECAHPQSQSRIAAELRTLADDLVRWELVAHQRLSRDIIARVTSGTAPALNREPEARPTAPRAEAPGDPIGDLVESLDQAVRAISELPNRLDGSRKAMRFWDAYQSERDALLRAVPRSSGAPAEDTDA